MPVATQFTTKGARNGFNFSEGPGSQIGSCFRTINVTDFDYWITASGYSKNDEATEPTDQQINDSFVNATKFYWNLNSTNFRGISIIETTLDSRQVDENIENRVIKFADVGNTNPIIIGDYPVAEPRDRICYNSVEPEILQRFSDGGSQVDSLSNIFVRPVEFVHNTHGFIGYGISDDTGDPWFVRTTMTGVDLRMTLTSFIEDEQDSSLWGENVTRTGFLDTKNFDFIQLGGIHMIQHSYIEVRNDSDTNGSFDVSGLPTSMSGSETGVTGTSQEGNSASASMQSLALDFYTY